MSKCAVIAGVFAFLLVLPGEASIIPQQQETMSLRAPDAPSAHLYKVLQSDGLDPQPENQDEKQTATLLNALGELYRVQGRYAEAEPLFRRSLEMRQKELGSGHTKVAESLNNLAVLYYNLQRYDDAEAMSRRSLSIIENAWGPDHPAVVQSLNNLASIYRVQGRYDDAIPLQMRAQEIAINSSN